MGHDSLAQGTGITKVLCQPLPQCLITVDRVLLVDSQGWNLNDYRVKVGAPQVGPPRPGFLHTRGLAYCQHTLMLLTERLGPECPSPPIHPTKLFIHQILGESFPELPLSTNAYRLNPTLTAWHSVLSYKFFLVATSSPQTKCILLEGKTSLVIPYLLTGQNHPLGIKTREA